MRLRLIELALTNAEEEFGYKLGRNFSLPRGVTYKGGVSGSRTPVPMPALRQLSESIAAEERMKQLKETAGPWKSKRSEAGLGSGRAAPKIVEMAGGAAGATKKSGVKKGFLTGASPAVISPLARSVNGRIPGGCARRENRCRADVRRQR